MADWKNISGGLTTISAGSRTHVWGVNAGGALYRYTGHDANPWVNIPGGASDIGVAADGNVWHVNSGGGIWRYATGMLPPWNSALRRVAPPQRRSSRP